jgi:hypothetical protein
VNFTVRRIRSGRNCYAGVNIEDQCSKIRKRSLYKKVCFQRLEMKTEERKCIDKEQSKKANFGRREASIHEFWNIERRL